MESVPFWMWIVGFLLVLGPLVTLHELGHYLAGRLFGVQAEAFSVGFGRELAGHTDRRGTRWKLAALPLGGYVQFKGDMNPASMPDRAAAAEEGGFHTRPLWQRAVIVLAGPLVNLAITVAIFAAFNLTYGKVEIPAVVGEAARGMPAAEAGIAEGDRIVAIDGEPMAGFRDVQRAVALFPGKRVVVEIERDGRASTVPLTLADETVEDEFGNASRIGRLGIAPAQGIERSTYGPVEAVGQAFVQTAQLFDMMVTGIVQIVTGERSVRELGGPVKIAKYSGEQLSLGWPTFVQFLALISLNLAFINLLPIPTLDGGHLAFYAAEAIRRRPVSAKGQEWAFRTGLALVLTLMVFVTINDVISLPVFGG